MTMSGTERTRYASNGGVQIAFEDLGGAGGDPLLLIMGMAVSRFWWPPHLVAELVGRGFHVVAYDQRDSGQSTRFAGEKAGGPLAAVLRRRSPVYTAEDMTDDAIAVMDAVGWESAHLLGHSMGGQLAQRIALRHPGRVRSVTSSASLSSDTGSLAAARYIHLGTVARLSRLRFPEGRDGDIDLAVEMSRLIASPAYPADESVIRQMAERDEVSGVRDTGAQSRQTGAKWHGGRLRDLRVPVLVLHGSADPLLRPAAARRTAAAIRDSRLVILPGVGHYLPAAVFGQIAGEVRALADRLRTLAVGGAGDVGDDRGERRDHQRDDRHDDRGGRRVPVQHRPGQDEQPYADPHEDEVHALIAARSLPAALITVCHMPSPSPSRDTRARAGETARRG
jgi:pimeloyl-ACP methyl ester carboxylesterase